MCSLLFVICSVLFALCSYFFDVCLFVFLSFEICLLVVVCVLVVGR